jgi:heterogeneous nuclear ribonucleoprotein L
MGWQGAGPAQMGMGMGMPMGMGGGPMGGPDMDMMPSRGGPPTGGMGCVLMIYGVNFQKFNAQKLFNLLCLYGNVMKVSK